MTNGLNTKESAKVTSAATREQYLNVAVHLLRERVFRPAGVGVPHVKVSVGFPGGGSARKRIGEHWHPKASADGVGQIFISPVLGNAYDAVETLTHELVHAVVPDAKHNKPFQKVCEKIGLTKGKPKSASAGPMLEKTLRSLITEMGDYPHAQISMADKKKQTTRLIKCECPDCGYVVRTTAKWIEELGAPYCPCEFSKPGKLSRMTTDYVVSEDNGDA